MNKTIFIIINSLTILLTCFFLVRLNSTRNSIDDLNQSLIQVKSLLTGQSNISLIATDEDYSQLYYQTQLVLAPNIVEKANVENDTILIINRHNYQKIGYPIEKYTILLSDSNSYFNILLCLKKYQL